MWSRLPRDGAPITRFAKRRHAPGPGRPERCPSSRFRSGLVVFLEGVDPQCGLELDSAVEYRAAEESFGGAKSIPDGAFMHSEGERSGCGVLPGGEIRSER